MTALLSLLQNIQNHSQQLLDCLKQEKQSLDNDQLEQLNEISAQKQVLINQLNKLDQQRTANCPDKDFNSFIANSNNSLLINQWDLTLKVISNCQHQNEINGRLLNKRSEINKDILTILTGRNQQADKTYDAQGNQTSNTSLLNGIKA